MGNKNVNSFTPAIAIPPGDTIRENMVYLGMKQEELAARLGVTTKHLSNILNGNAPITYETAIKLELVVGPSAEFWMEMESNYQINKIRLKKKNQLSEDIAILKMIPYKDMSKLGWVESTEDKVKRVDALKNFFGVGNLGLIQHTYQVAYRKHKQISAISDYALLAWLRKVELEGLKIETGKFSKRKLREIIPNLRVLTLESPSLAFDKMQALCAKCGISVVLVEYLSQTYACGASIWKGDKVIVAANDRGKRADIFWFSFFHEIAHLLKTNTRKKESHVCFDDQEREIDRIAGNLLLPEKLYQRFLREYKDKSKSDITDYAKKINVAPYILAGRLLHEGLIDHKKYGDLLLPFDIGTMK